jgi:hypothetical protein
MALECPEFMGTRGILRRYNHPCENRSELASKLWNELEIGDWKDGQQGALKLTGDKPSIKFAGGALSGNESWALHLGSRRPGNLEHPTLEFHYLNEEGTIRCVNNTCRF